MIRINDAVTRDPMVLKTWFGRYVLYLRLKTVGRCLPREMGP